MEDKIKVTILTATYNSGTTLEQAISSVVNQDYDNIEYIIIDGASTDNTIDIIKKYEPYGIKWISEPDDGLYDALNKGIEMATGDYLQVLGSDDSLYSKSTISNIVGSIDDGTDILVATVMNVDEKTKNEYLEKTNQRANKKNNYNGGMIPHQGMFVKTSIARLYKFDINYKITADYKFFLQCFYNDDIKFKVINKPVAFYSNGGMSCNWEMCCVENNNIYHELGLPFHDSVIKIPKWRRCIKDCLQKLGLLDIIQNIKRRLMSNGKLGKHHCNNKICRWCGRM